MSRTTLLARRAVLLALGSWLAPALLFGGVDVRLFQQPDVSATEIAFIYAGDVWVVPKSGGSAVRLSTPAGEEQFPRFSPDGTSIAYSASYGGNQDAYVIATEGGIPRRLTYHPDEDRVLDWYPDGGSILIASERESGKARFRQLYRQPIEGGLPQKLPLPYGEFGTIAADGKTLAYVPISCDFRTWKRYRGGMAADIWIFDLATRQSTNATSDPANDGQPMWHGSTLYFLSDRDEHRRSNIWKRDGAGRISQVTRFREFDVRFPAIGPDDLVFEAGGELYRLSLNDSQLHEVDVRLVSDRVETLPRMVDVGDQIRWIALSPGARRVAVQARGEVFSVPAEHGPVMNLTRSSGVAERGPAWSPDGKEIAYFSDRSGEYDLVVQPAAGGEEVTLAALGPGFRYHIFWSPDGRKLAWAEQNMKIRLYDRDRATVEDLDRGLFMMHGELDEFRAVWSPDSRWLTWSRALESGVSAIFVYDAADRRKQQVTSGFYADRSPIFDPEGKYLFFLTNRTFDLTFSDFDNTWVYANSTTIASVPLRNDVPSLLLARNDTDSSAPAQDGDEKQDGVSPSKQRKQASVKASSAKEPPVEDAVVPAVTIDFEGIERRVVVLPPAAGNYGSLQAIKGKLVYLQTQPVRDEDSAGGTLKYYDLEAREEKTVMEGVADFEASTDGEKLLVVKQDKFSIVELGEGVEIEKTLPTERLSMALDPPAEWRQMFHDVWRIERDFFYDPGLHGVDWNAMHERYGALLASCVTRWDLNFLIGELIAELNASHAYRGGGDTSEGDALEVGLLGVDWAVDAGHYRIERIVRAAEWDTEVRSPLDAPGVGVNEGAYVLAVNGEPLEIRRDPWAGFQGLAGAAIELTVNDRPSLESARRVVVETLSREQDYRLRNLAWIEGNRRAVEAASNGRVGYVYVPSTSVDGHLELFRMIQSQSRKAAMIIDERFNDGGFIPDRMIELLNRPVTNYWAVRDGMDWRWPPGSHVGPKVMLINGWSGSGGDAFPYYFRQAGLGPLIGTRTWGGLIGISGSPDLIDGGGATVPTFSFYDTQGNWAVENHGVVPDIEVVDDPAQMWDGSDPQLERAIAEALARIETDGWTDPPRPAYPDRSGF